jgi:hypothetical protein
MSSGKEIGSVIILSGLAMEAPVNLSGTPPDPFDPYSFYFYEGENGLQFSLS